ncbi:MAG: lmo0937 family membrane protein [Candidatus Gracilibacteria bacterium]|nr:lmo0937 family membrane protein [Candidatus Gracilibacteria bacterium]
MLLTIGIILIALWLVGFIGFHVVSGFIHLLLVIAIIVILTRLIRGK